MLAGVRVPHDRGLAGHSDADVVAHAVMDALLGAAGLGDIGGLFPDSDEAYAGADSLQLLTQVAQRVRAAGYGIRNIDVVIVCQQPRLADFRDEMRANLARAAAVEPQAVGVKATTTEGMGFEGRGEGISATAVCLIAKKG